MPIDLQIIRAHEFIRLDAHGHLDFEGSREVFKMLAQTCQKRGTTRAMLDVRNMRASLTPSELGMLVGDFCSLGFTRQQRLALLHTPEQDYRANLFALISHSRGWKVEAFDDFEKALDWLALNDDRLEDREPVPGEQEIPIKTVQSAKESRQTKTIPQ